MINPGKKKKESSPKIKKKSALTDVIYGTFSLYSEVDNWSGDRK